MEDGDDDPMTGGAASEDDSSSTSTVRPQRIDKGKGRYVGSSDGEEASPNGTFSVRIRIAICPPGLYRSDITGAREQHANITYCEYLSQKIWSKHKYLSNPTHVDLSSSSK